MRKGLFILIGIIFGSCSLLAARNYQGCNVLVYNSTALNNGNNCIASTGVFKSCAAGYTLPTC